MRSSPRFLKLAVAAAITLVIVIAWFTSASIRSAEDETAPDQPTGLEALAGDTQVKLSWDDPGDDSITSYELWQLTQSGKLTGATSTKFGFSVAVAGDIAVVGMPEDDESISKADSGALLVFARDSNGDWSQAAKLTASDAAADDKFGSSVAFDGATIVVGAPFNDHNSLVDPGSAYVFEKPSTGWADGTETAKLTAPDAKANDEFGSNAVAVDGDTIVVGAYGRDISTGVAYVFTKPGTDVNGDGSIDWEDWVSTLTATLTTEGAESGDEFGSSVAIDGNTVVVGASGDDGRSGTEATDFVGSAFVFVKPNSTGWVSTSTAAKLIAETRGNQDYFGRSVAIDGDTIVVGADGQETNTGSAYAFTKPGTGWANGTETARLTASDGAMNDRFGYSVAVDGDTVVVGAYGNGGSRGSAYAFTKPASGWADGTEAAQITASDRAINDRFGSSVAIDGDTIVVGAENNDAAYVFGSWDDIVESDAETTSHIVTGLTNGTAYAFRVRAVNTFGASDPSDSVSETPKASYAPARPLNFSATQTGAGQVELTWDAHRYPLSVTGYAYSQNDGGGPSWTDIDGSDSSTVSHTVTGLFEGVTYTFAVSAINSTGSTESDSRSVTIVGTPAAPDSFSAVAGDGQVWLGWRSPADFTISGYEYRQKEGTDAFGDWQTIPGSRAGSTFHIVTGLTNGTSYTFQVRAVNAAGESDSSGEQSATPATASSAPVKPEGFAARQTGVVQVELTWEASSNPLNVTGYQFEQSSGSWTTISESDHSTVSHIITGLTQGVAYTFRVRAVNSTGSTESAPQSVTLVDIPAAPAPFAAAAGDTQVRLTWEDPDNASITKYQLWQFPPTSIKLVSNDRADDDELGWSVAVDGDTLVIGALGDDPNNTGAAYVFTRNSGGWTQAGKLTAADRENDAGFGHAVAVHGDTIVVGAYEEDHTVDTDNLDDFGAAYVFTKPATGWGDNSDTPPKYTETARLTADDAAANDEFGTSVAVHGDTIVVGAPEEDSGARGSAYIFTRPANGWVNTNETATLIGDTGGDRFGRSVAVHGDTVVVGAHEEGANDQGEAYVFTKSAATGVWDDWNGKNGSNATARLTASDRANNDRFGRAVAMDGDTVIVGAYLDDGTDSEGTTFTDSGSAYVFTKPATGWGDNSDTPPKYTETAKLTASDRAKNDEFGYSVAVDGDTIVVGARQPSYIDDGEEIRRPGAAYLFSKPATGWTDTAGTGKLVAYDRSGNDQFGNSVAVDGYTVLVGAAGDDSDKGSAYVFGTEWSDIPGSGAGTTSHIARGLRNNVEHTFRVRAVNAAGAGRASEEAATPMSANSLPSVPADYTATQVGIGEVRLAWTASTKPLTVRHYTFKRGSQDWAKIDGSDSSTVSHTVTGLTTGNMYNFDVRAVNGAGSGPAPGFAPVTIVDRPETPTGFGAVAGDEQVKLNWNDPGADSPPIDKYQLWQLAERPKLEASGTPVTRAFGNSLAIDGDTAVVGARVDKPSVGGPSVGAAYVFTRDPDSNLWKQAAKLTASDGEANDNFGISVAIDGSTIVVGAHEHDADGVSDAGAAYVFTKPASGWSDMTQTAKFTALGAAADDEFGYSVAVHDETIVVGAHEHDADGVSDAGAAYVFTKPYIGWRNTNVSAKLTLNPSTVDGRFGHSVAVLGDTVMIGAIGVKVSESEPNYTGAVYVFTRPETGWADADTGSKPRLAASDGKGYDTFGWSVAMDGDTVVIGARGDEPNDDNLRTGSAYMFIEPSGGWANDKDSDDQDTDFDHITETAKLTASDGAEDDEFGISVAVHGNTIVVGAHQDDDATNGDNSGSAYVFTKPAAGRATSTETIKLLATDGAEDDLFGFSVAVDGDSLLVGAYQDDGIAADGVPNVSNAGIVYVFGNPEEWTDIPDSGVATTTSHIVTGLTNDEEHTFQVRGVNAAGAGFASAGAGGTPTFALPDPPDGLTADTDDTVVDLSWVDPEDSTIEKYQMLQIQGGKLTAASTDDPVVRGDGFGISVAADGDIAVVGAYQDDDATNGDNSGSVHVFTRSSSAAPWSWLAKLTASDAAANDEFGISVAVDGDTIVVGAHQNDSSKGAAYVFTWNSSNSKWEQKAKLTASDAAANDEFGIAVAVDGDTIVVGAHQNDSNKGAAYVFTKPESDGWADATETAKLTASDAAASDELGISVAVYDETIVVGAHQSDSNKGAAYVFTKPGSDGWADATETAKLTASDAAANDELGISVAVHGDTIVVGAHKYDVDDNGTSIPNAGAAYVFTKPVNGWATSTSTANLIASDAARGDEFGISVAIDDDTVVVGAYLDDDNGDNSGSAYVFTRDSNGWSQKTKLTGPSRGKGYWLGHSVAVVGNTVIAGADKSNISGPDSGAVYLWTVPGWTDIVNSDATTTSLTVTGLTNRVEYSFQVRAVDNVEGVGAGPPSEVRATPLKPRPAKPTGLSAAPGDTQVRVSWDLPGESSPPTNSYQLWQHAENAMLTAPSPAADDEFGYAVAIDGDIAVVGMPGEDDGTILNVGAAFVFTSDSSGTWSQVAKLRASDPNAQDRFGLSVAVHEDTSNGDTIVIGAPHHSSSRGAVYVFTEPSGGWASTSTAAKLTASDAEANDEFGTSVAVDGDTVVVGAHNNNAAYVFTRPATGWADTTETLKLSRSGSSDDFGRSVAIDGDTVVVGASGVDSGRGSAFVFTKPATGWANSPGTEVAELTAYSRNDNDKFGRSVAIDGDTIVVGANGNDYDDDDNDTDDDEGAAYVFIKPDTGWANSPGTETAMFTASDGKEKDQFGVSVAMDGDTVVIGADALNETNSTGSAYVFTKPAAGWADSTEAAKLTGSGTANGDRFGLSVSVDGLTVMVGANGQGGGDQGAAYVYGIQDWSPITGSTGETTSQLVTGLTNGLEHTFAVRAVNDGGESVPSDQTSETPAGAVSLPIKPRNFSAVQFGAGEVRLEWERSVQPLTIVRFDYTDDGTNWKEATGSHSTTASYTVSDLMVDTTYTFAVRAVNSAGAGVSSDPWSVTIAAAPDRPTALTAVAGDEQVELSWRYSGGQTSTTGFQYQQKTEGDFGDDWTDVTGSTWTTTSHIVTGLTNDIPYTFRVRAVNVTIGSDTTNEEDATPSASGSRPARPTNFNAEQTGVGQVELTWDTAGARLTVTGYQYTADSGSNWNNISGSDSGTNSHTVSGLTTETTYTFAVRAVNSGTPPGLPSVSRDVTIDGEPRPPTGLGATGGDTQATFHWNVTVETTDRPIEKHQLLHLPQSKLTADDGSDDDEFGYSVAIDGSTVVVGAHQDDDATNGDNSGSAYVFTRSSPAAPWSQTAKLTASDAAADDKFGISVAIDGDTIVVGAHQNDDDGDSSGAAYVFTKSGNVWVTGNETAKLAASDAAVGDAFGISVAVHGDTVVVGAHLENANDEDQDDTNDVSDAGAVYVFTKPDTDANGDLLTDWKDWDSLDEDAKAALTAKLTASDGAANDELGISVAIDGDTVVAGAHLHDIDDNGSSILNAGAAYVFTKPTDGWTDNTEGAKFTAPDGAADDEFGISVAIDVNTVVVGAHKHDVGANTNAGAAYIFTRDSNSGKWGQPLKLTASNGHADDGFGNSVAVDGNTAVVGAYLDDRDTAALDTGSTYVFARQLGMWSETLNLAGPDPGQNDRLGYSVAVDDGTLLAGVPQGDLSRGSAYAMDISTAKWANLVSTELTDDGEDYFYRVLNLTNDQEYAFRVRSVNAAANRPSNETVSATPKLGRPVKPTGLVAEARDRAVELSWDLSDDSTISRYQVLQHPEQSRLTASDGADGDKFGSAVAVDGGTAVVGAPQDDDNGVNSGAAYVFTRDTLSGEWSQPIKLTASDGEEDDWFGHSVAVHGDTIVIGAYKHDLDSESDAGAAYVFTKPDGGWVATSTAAKLTDSDGKKNDWFGYSVAVHESTIVVGARGYDGNKGAAYVFTKPDGGDWTSTSTAAKLTASDGAGSDYFGNSVAVDRDTIVTGAYRHKANGVSNTGAAYVFIRPVGGWVATSTAAKLSASNGDDGDQFGRSVAVDGDTVVIGAQQDDGDRGSAYVFTDAIEMTKLTASDRGANDYFGSSVAVRGGTIVIGAPSANIDVCDDIDDCDEDPRSGAAYVFTKPTGAFWANDPNEDNRKESGKLTLPIEEGDVEKDDEFGNSVALDGQSIVVGAPAGNDGFGSVYVSDIPQWSFLAGGAETTSATVGGLTNGVGYTFQVRAVDKVSDVGESPPSNIARATPMPAPDAPSTPQATNSAPSFGGVSSITRAVAENTLPGADVDSAVTATDPDGDTLVYSLSDEDPASFNIDSSNGQLSVGAGTTLDYESGNTSYTVIVYVHDGKDADGNTDTAIDDSIDVTIDVTNEEEAGTVSLSSTQPELNTELTVSLTDPDGWVTNVTWQWARSADRDNWSDIPEADSNTYTPVSDDVGHHLRATATYEDGHGPGKSAAATTYYRVEAEDTSNRAPSFGGVSSITRAVAENTLPGADVDSAVTAMDPDGDTLVYSLSDEDPASFSIDSSNGQLSVGAETTLDYESGNTSYTVIASVHDGKDADGNTDTAIDDSIDVTIDVTNEEEAGTVSLSSTQPELNTELTVSLTDPDGWVTNVTWQWARSADRDNWSDISEADSNTYTPVSDDVGHHLRATATYEDGHGPGKSAAATTYYRVEAEDTSNRAPSFGGVSSITRAVAENTLPGADVDSAVTATDPDGDTLVYSLSDEDPASFNIDSSDGQLSVGAETTLDYESGNTSYTVIVSVHDGKDAGGNTDTDTAIDDSIDVTIDVTNEEEAGTVSMSSTQPELNTELTVSLTDPDGWVTNVTWQWARSADRDNWSDIPEADSNTYTPVSDDVGHHLRATATYEDGHGPGKSAPTVSANRVGEGSEPSPTPTPTPTQAPTSDPTMVPKPSPTRTPTPTPTPEPTPTPTPTPEPTPTPTGMGPVPTPLPGVDVGGATPPPGLLLAIGLAGVLLVVVGVRTVRRRRSDSRL